MRTLRKNTVSMWYVEPSGYADTLDSEGNFTGERNRTYSDPKSISLPLIPATGDVLLESFGETSDVDYISNSTNFIEKDTLLFLEKPISNYNTTYDFTITKIKSSLNHNVYGLRRRSNA